MKTEALKIKQEPSTGRLFEIWRHTHYLCIFATLPELLHSVGMFYIVHRDRVDHHHSIILSKMVNKGVNQQYLHTLSDLTKSLSCLIFSFNVNRK